MRNVTSLSLMTLFLLTASATRAQEDEGQYVDYGGVLVPVPDRSTSGPRIISPDNPTGSSAQDEGVQRVEGRAATRTDQGADGQEIEIHQSTRVAGVSESNAENRFDWFYNALDIYTGIIPNLRDTLPHISPYQRSGASTSRPNRVTWIGFQAFDEYTRVFIQFARPPRYSIEESEEGHLLEIQLDNTRLSLSNFTRFMDTSYFERSVEMIDAEYVGGNRARVVIFRGELSPYDAESEGNYLYIDFQDTH